MENHGGDIINQNLDEAATERPPRLYAGPNGELAQIVGTPLDRNLGTYAVALVDLKGHREIMEPMAVFSRDWKLAEAA